MALTAGEKSSVSEMHPANQMNTQTAMPKPIRLAHEILSRRRKMKALRLRLAEAKAEAMEAVYGPAASRPFWVAVGAAEKAVKMHWAD
jgi:hypothetical protein